MAAAVTALRRIAERQQKALVCAGQILQPQIAIGREAEGFAGEVAHHRTASTCGDGSIRPSRPRMSVTRGIAAGDASAVAGASAWSLLPVRIEQAVGVVEGRPENLPSRNILEGRGDPPRAPASGRCRQVRSPRNAARWRGTPGPGRSPRSCRRAPASGRGRRVGRSYSEPSVMTWSTAEAELFDRSASSESRERRGRPAALSASSRWAFSMAVSPPLTATYMLQSLS